MAAPASQRLETVIHCASSRINSKDLCGHAETRSLALSVVRELKPVRQRASSKACPAIDRSGTLSALARWCSESGSWTARNLFLPWGACSCLWTGAEGRERGERGGREGGAEMCVFLARNEWGKRDGGDRKLELSATGLVNP